MTLAAFPRAGSKTFAGGCARVRDAASLPDKADADPRLGYELMRRLAELLTRRMQSARLRLLDLNADAHSS